MFSHRFTRNAGTDSCLLVFNYLSGTPVEVCCARDISPPGVFHAVTVGHRNDATLATDLRTQSGFSGVLFL